MPENGSLYKRLLQEKDDLEQRLAVTQDELRNTQIKLIEKRDELNQRKQEMTKESIDELNAEVEALRERNKKLEMEKEKLSSECSILKARVETLHKKNEELEIETFYSKGSAIHGKMSTPP